MNSEDAVWTVVDKFYDKQPILFRYRNFERSFARVDYPHRLNIFWSVQSTYSSGLPDDSELERLKKFEDRLVESTGFDTQAILVVVLTGRGKREFVVQTRDPDEFLECLERMPQDHDPYPIEILHFEDEHWEYFDGIVDDLEE